MSLYHLHLIPKFTNRYLALLVCVYIQQDMPDLLVQFYVRTVDKAF